MCVLKISQEIMEKAGLKDEHDALVEFACRLFDAGRLSFDGVMEMAGLNEQEVVQALTARRIRINYYKTEDAEKELGAFARARS